MATVRLEHVSKSFGDTLIVNDIDLVIQDREFLVLLGPSGCGKTTTLRMIAGLEDISGGHIFIGDRQVDDVPPKNRDIAMVFQSYALYPHMSVFDNMAFALKLRKMPKAQIQQRVNEVAETLSITPLLKRKPRQLSGGQRQRVALGRAIVREPQVFLMDEPLSNLDAQLRVQTRSELIKLHQRLQATIVYVTHDQTEAMTMGTRIAIMRSGVLQQLGAPTEVYDHPANMFVAGFIGTPAMNFFPVEVQTEGDTLYAHSDSFRLALPPVAKAAAQALGSRQAVMGIRPENIHEVVASDEAENKASLPVDVVEHMGNETLVHFQVGAGTAIARLDAQTSARPGAKLDVAFDPSRILLFDPTTERALTA